MIEATVPKIAPRMPNSNMRMSFVNQTGKGNIPSHFRSLLSFQKVRMSRIGGKMSASALLATAPRRVMRLPR